MSVFWFLLLNIKFMRLSFLCGPVICLFHSLLYGVPLPEYDIIDLMSVGINVSPLFGLFQVMQPYVIIVTLSGAYVFTFLFC